MFIQLKLIKEKRKQSYQEKEAEMIERINQADPQWMLERGFTIELRINNVMGLVPTRRNTTTPSECVRAKGWVGEELECDLPSLVSLLRFSKQAQ